jgi:2-aminoadipate transaminase
VPGKPFFAGTPERGRLRLSFASATSEQIADGIRRLGDCIRSEFEAIAKGGQTVKEQ